MARYDVKCLDSGYPFSDMALHLPSGEIMNIPQELGEGYALFLLYRGYW